MIGARGEPLLAPIRLIIVTVFVTIGFVKNDFEFFAVITAIQEFGIVPLKRGFVN